MKIIKKILLTFVSVVSLCSCGERPTEEEKNGFIPETNLYEKISAFNLSSVKTNLENKDLTINTYVNENFVNKSVSTPLIVYALNTGTERIGQEQNSDIIKDLLKENIVVTVDYSNAFNDLNVVAKSLLSIRNQIDESNSYVSGLKVNKNHIYVLPEGYKIKKDVEFFDITKSASKGTIDFIVDIWNSSFVSTNSKVSSRWKHANSIDDIVMKSGEKLYKTDENGEHPYMKYKMDIIYPSNPTKKAPVMDFASNYDYRNGATGHSDFPLCYEYILFGLKGYVTACHDHEYIPFMNSDNGGYGHIQEDSSYGYSIMRYDGVKVRTAAIRCLKYYADELGYSNSLIGAVGHSKGSWASCLAKPNPEIQDEDLVYGTYTKGENNGEQPFLKNKNGRRLTGDVSCLYYAMGWGTQRYEDIVDPLNKPTYIACSARDKFGHYDYFQDEIKCLKKNNVEFVYSDMTDQAHTMPPASLQPIYKYNYLDSFMNFFDYYIGNGNPTLAYTSVVNSALVNNELVVQFNCPIKEESMNNVKVNSGNAPIEGTWRMSCGGTRYEFVSSALKANTEYSFSLNGVVAKNGKSISNLEKYSFTK